MARARMGVPTVVLALGLACGAVRAAAAPSRAPMLAFDADNGIASEIYVARPGEKPVRLTTHAPTGTEPAIAPDGTTIAFKHDEAIWAMAADGSGVHPVSRSIASDAAWSPDGRQIAFIANFRIHVSDASGRNQRVIGPANADGPLSWSSTGLIAFKISTRAACGIYVIRPDGSGRKPFLPADRFCSEGFAWAPDGGSFALVAYDQATKRDVLEIVRSDGTGLHELPSTHEAFGSPTWSPDGTTLLFTAADGFDQTDLFSVGVDGRNRTQLTHSGKDAYPSWSRDGGTVAYAHADGIWVMDPSGANQRALGHAGYAVDPAWSPRGDRIAYTEVSGGREAIDVVPAAGGTPVQVVANGADPAWSPDGRRIVFVRLDADQVHELWVVPSNGKGPAASLLYGAAEPAWAPSGKLVAYTDTTGPDEPGGGADLAIGTVRPNGRGSHPIVRPEEVDMGAATWSPDSRSIAFYRGGAVFVTDTAGRRSRRVVRRAVDPAWAPDGKSIAFVRGGRILGIDLRSKRISTLVAFGGAESPSWQPAR